MNAVSITTQSCGYKGYDEVRIAFGDMQNCQLKCPFCFTIQQKPSLEALSSLTQRSLENIKIIRFTGGEPLLHQEQIDGMIYELQKIAKHQLINLELIVIQTNAISAKNNNIDGLLQFELPIIFEVSLKGTNIREYQYLTGEYALNKSQAGSIFKKQIEGYNIISSKCGVSNHIAVLMRLGIFHSSVNRPTFKFIFSDTKELMFNPNDWSPEFAQVALDQKMIWGQTFEGKVLVEKIKTPADGSPGIGKRYRNIIEQLKRKGLLEELISVLPNEYHNRYLYKRGNEIYWRCANIFRLNRG